MNPEDQAPYLQTPTFDPIQKQKNIPGYMFLIRLNNNLLFCITLFISVHWQ
jgi:hypothetical protein